LLERTDNQKKTNEIPTLRELLNAMRNIKGRIITADALHTQRETARCIVEEKKADYVFTVKDNQKTLKENIIALRLENTAVQAETIEKAHGRIETRRIQTSEAINDYVVFPYVKQVFRIERERTNIKTGKTSVEVVFGVTSRSASDLSPADLLAVNRGHWGIEALHHVRDRTFDEDRSQIRKKNGPRVMAGLRNFVISLFRLMKITNIAEANRHFAAKPSLSLSIFGI
jgi:predicted transposase YbfD/YdcC